MAGTIQRLPSGNYRAMLRIDGRTHTPGHSFSTRREAQLWIAEAMIGAPSQPLGVYATSSLGGRTLRPKTYETYARCLGDITNPDLGISHLPIQQVTSATVTAWHGRVRAMYRVRALRRSTERTEPYMAKAWGIQQGVHHSMQGPCPADVFNGWRHAGRPDVLDKGAEPGAASAAQSYRFLSSVMNQAVRDGLIRVNPCQVRGAGNPPLTVRSTLTPDEVDALSLHMPERFRFMPTFAAWTGLRLGELTALRVQDVDQETGRVMVSGHEKAPLKTRESVRQVYLPSHLHKSLAGHVELYTGITPWLFSRENGNRLTSSHISRMFTAAKVRIGRPDVTWHSLRHSSITWALEAGVPLTVVQARAGHADVGTTMGYTHHSERAQRDAADRLAQFRFR